MIYIILPVYNEGKSIYNLLGEYYNFFEKYNIKDYKIIVVNDCSKDDSEKFIFSAKQTFNLKIDYILHNPFT